MNERLVAGAPVGARRARPAGGSPAGPDQRAQEPLAAPARPTTDVELAQAALARRDRLVALPDRLAAQVQAITTVGHWPPNRASPRPGIGTRRPVHEAVAAFLYQPWGLQTVASRVHFREQYRALVGHALVRGSGVVVVVVVVVVVAGVVGTG